MFYSTYLAQNDLNSHIASAFSTAKSKLDSKNRKANKNLDALEALPASAETSQLIAEAYSELEVLTAADNEFSFLNRIDYNECRTLAGVEGKLKDYASKECNYSSVASGRKLVVELLIKELSNLR